jgi:Mrp family chromosome partitioning ATPase
MAELIDLLRDAFDTVLLDSPPVLAVTDASILAKKADGVVLVVRSGLTEGDAALMARSHLEQVKARVIGVVVNDFDYETNYYRKGYYKYYTSYYRSEDEGDGKRKKRVKKLEPAASRKKRGLGL